MNTNTQDTETEVQPTTPPQPPTEYDEMGYPICRL